jgi:hypothetical protein
MEYWSNGIVARPSFQLSLFQYFNFRIWRKVWRIKKQEEVLGTGEIVQDSAWASNGSVDSGFRRETFSSVKRGLVFIQERMLEWEKTIAFLRESTESSNTKRREEIKSR